MATKKEEFLKRTNNGTFAKVYLDGTSVFHQGPNARTSFDRAELDILKGQIRQEGVLQPLVVKREDGGGDGSKLKIFDGERRMRCVQELVAEGVEIEWVPVVIRRASEADLMIEAAMTDTGKCKLDPVDQANLVRMLVNYGHTQTEISTKLNVSPPWVSTRLNLAVLEPPLKDALRNKELTIGKAEELSEKSRDDQLAELNKIRGRKAQGEKKAGSTQPKKPGKRQIRQVAADMLREDRYYSAGQVEALLKWVMGETDEAAARKALKPLKKMAAREADQPIR